MSAYDNLAFNAAFMLCSFKTVLLKFTNCTVCFIVKTNK